MQPAPIGKIKEIFLHARDLSPERVAAYLEQACAGDTDLRARVERLLAQDTASAETDFLSPVPTEARTTTATLPRVLVPSERVANRFRIIRFVGRGGMGDVYEAEDTELGGRVALKTIRQSLIGDAQAEARFRREIQLSRQVTHPNICRVFDVGHDKDLTFLTMEFLDGETLGARLARDGKFSEASALELLKQMAAGLDALHAHGIVHRDLKPGNVMLVNSTGGVTRAVIADFGLARNFDTDDTPTEAMTQAGVIIGTPAYMAPEQLIGGRATRASDIYSFAVLAYEMVTGKRLFTVETAMEHALSRVTTPSLEGLSPSWNRTLRAALDRLPSDRPTSASAVTGALEGTRVLPPRRRRSWIPAAIVAGLLVVAGAFAWRQFRQTTPPTGSDRLLEARELLRYAYRPGSAEKALRLLEAEVAEHPSLAIAHSQLGSAAQYRNRETDSPEWLEKARTHAQRAVELDPELYNPHLLLASIHSQMDRPDAASVEFRRALALAPRAWDVHLSYGLHLQSIGRREEAEKEIRLAVDLAPEQWRTQFGLANFLSQANRDAEAVSAFNEVIRLTPDNPEAFNNLGALHWRQGRYKEARLAFERSLALVERTRTYTNLAGVLRVEGDSDRAIEMLRKAASMPDATQATWASLASAFWNTPGRRAEAREPYLRAIAMAEEIRKKQPQNARFVASLASYYAAVGKIEDARRDIRQALAMDAADMQIAVRAAEVYELINEREEAIRWLAKAVSMGYPLENARRNTDLAPLLNDPRYPKTRR